MKSVHRSLSKRQKTAVGFHLTALDIHPAAIAKNLVFLLLLNELVDGQAITPETKAEVIATHMYAFLGVIMPNYCHKRWAWYSLYSPLCNSIAVCRLMTILDDLCDRLSENPPRLPSWIYVPLTSIPPILGAIHYWMDTAKTAETEMALKLHTIPDISTPTPPTMGTPGPMFPRPGNMAAYADKLIQEVASTGLEGMTGEQLVQTGLLPIYVSPNQARQYFERHKAQLIESMVKRMRAAFPSASTDGETKWYTMTKTLPLPKELMARHMALKQFSDAMRQNRDTPKSLISKVAPSRQYSVLEGSPG